MKSKYIDIHSREAVSLFCNLDNKYKPYTDANDISSIIDAVEALPEVKSPANIAEWADDVHTYTLIQQLLDRINRESLPFIEPGEHEELGSMLAKIAAGYDKKYEALDELEAPFETEDALPNNSDSDAR